MILSASIYQFATFFIDGDGDGYDGGSASVCKGTTTPLGYATSSLGLDCDDSNSAIFAGNDGWMDADGDGYAFYDPLTEGGPTYFCLGASGYLSLENFIGYDCDDTNPLLNPANPCSTGKVVNLTMFVQGYYLGGSTMNSVKLNQWDGLNAMPSATDVEDMTVELHDALDYSLVDTAVGTLQTDGTLSVTFNTAAAGSYYVAVKGSNIVQTWSATPQTLGAVALSYDFSSAASQAYGDNMLEAETGVFAMYQGELVIDDLVDTQDYSVWEVSYLNGDFGVQPTDLNGDGLVDTQDYAMWEVNYLLGVFASYPF